MSGLGRGAQSATRSGVATSQELWNGAVSHAVTALFSNYTSAYEAAHQAMNDWFSIHRVSSQVIDAGVSLVSVTMTAPR